MAKNPKAKDPTEIALDAIQDALNFNDKPSASTTRSATSRAPDLRSAIEDAAALDEPRFGRLPANDDRETIGAMLQTIQKGRPRRSAYTVATLFAGLWIAACGILTFAFLPAIEAIIGQETGGALALVGLGAMFLAPLVLFYFMASLAWRSQELSLIAQSMAQMAIRFSEPEKIAGEGMVNVGQAIRREVAAMGDGVERAIARAGELEALVSNEVASLERAYSDNEVRMRAMLTDIAVQRDNLIGQAEHVRNAISGVQVDLRQDIALISDAIAARVDEVAQNITNALEERSEHITRALNNAGDNMIIALGERGGDLLDRLEEASSQTAASVLDASERLTESLNFKTGHVHEEFADLADRVHEMLNERIDRITGEFEHKSLAIVDGISARTENVHDTLRLSGDSLLAQLDLRSSDLVSKLDGVGDDIAARILSNGDKAAEALDATVNALVSKVVSQTETAHEALTGQINTFDGIVRQQGAELAEKFARDSGTLGALIVKHISEFDHTVKTFGGDVVERMGTHTQSLTDNLKTYVDTFDTRVTTHGEAIHTKLDQRLTDFQTAIDTRMSALDTSLDAKTTAFTDLIQSRGEQLTGTMTARFQEMHDGLDMRFGAVAGNIATLVSQFDTLLDTRVAEAAGRVTVSGQQAADIIMSRSEEMSLGLKTRVEDAERALTSLMTDTSEAIQTSARAAQQSLLNLSGEVNSQLKQTATDIERSVQLAAREAENTLVVASSNASSQIKSSSAEIERTIASSTDQFGLTLGGKVEAITDGVRAQTDRLSTMIDERRGSLVDAIGSKADEIAGVIGSATDSALKTIENHGGAFTVAMMNNSTDLARQINTASEVAIGAVSKSLKDIEESSRAAIEQSRNVATSTVTELQETSKILRTDTLALFERLREGNILLQEVLTGAHENLNSLERTLVTRVADFVTTMNDVTTKNGASTVALEEQLGIFNAKTAGALDDLAALATQFDGHGRALAEAARLVDQSNARTTDTVSERNAQLESLVNTIDLRTLDMDERLHRFTKLLEESLDAAEARARDIAQVVAETAGASSAAVSRQFESVRMAVEDERRQTSEAMAEIYDQGTREADAMFRQAADKFASIVHSMKQMAGELHSELDATRAELRKGVLDLPQEAAESTSQMRKVIVDQIEALAELNRIVARHGRGLDVAATNRVVQTREEEPAMAMIGARQDSAPQRAPAPPRARDNGGTNLPPPDFGAPAPRRTEAPPMSPVSADANNDGWLSNMLNRAPEQNEPPRGPSRPATSGNPLEQLALDITRLVDRELAAEMWDRYQRGERKAFTKRLYTPSGQKAFEDIARKYRAERNFKQTVDRYINEFEKLLDDVSRDERGPAALRSQLVSETGLVYTLLAHAAGRLG